MILVDNRNVLRMKDRELLNRLTAIENSDPSGNVIIEQAKTGVPTLKIAIDGKMQYVHSKYDPEKDVARFVSKFENETYKHVLFVGTGLGYHIKKYTEAHPDTKFSIYEPDEEVLLTYLTHVKLDALAVQNLVQIFTGTDTDDIRNKMHQLLQSSKGILQIITLPIYERIYGEQIDTIMKKTLEILKDKRSSLATNYSFQQRWTINSIKNFPTVLKTPNILHDIDKSAFEGEPAIIVAAGPSLNEEFENLRYIKEHGLAYIFSVGSSINALIEHGIYPDATCAYDPQALQYIVTKIIKDKELTEIPLIFGSSVGFETLTEYPGKMLHAIVSQDTVAPALLKHKDVDRLDYVNDAPSIAVITFQLLSKLKLGKIILVGQNLAYIDNKHYAKGIDYGTGTSEVTDEALAAALTTKDVNGEDVRTTEGFNRMRQQLEMYIAQSPHVEVINTTVGGAAIQGTVYKPLSEIIEQQLKDKVVPAQWAIVDNNYDQTYVTNRLAKLNVEVKNLEKVIKNGLSIVERISQDVKLRKLSHLEKSYIQLDKEIDHIKGNQFYNAFIEPMIRVQIERFTQEVQSVRFDRNPFKKGEIIGREFHMFLAECSVNYNLAVALYEEMKTKIQE